MKAKFEGDIAFAEKEAISELYQSGYFGRPKKEGLELSLVEAAYLLSRGKLEPERDGVPLDFRAFFEQASLKQPNFELKYIVYKDLRERGYYVQPSAEDFRVYPRGSHPGKSAAKIFVKVQSERQPLAIKLLQESAASAENVHKEFVLSVVDEESDITFYEVKEKILTGEMSKPYPSLKAEATFLEDRVIVWEAQASKSLYSEGFYGKMLDSERLQLSLIESLYLLSEGVINVKNRKGKVMAFEEFIEKASELQSSFFQKYLAYKALRDSGHVVKTGFKFGTHFRVYRKVESLEKIPHSEYLINVTSSDFEFRLPVLSGAVRLANSVRKRMVFAIEEEGKIKYLDIGRIKM